MLRSAALLVASALLRAAVVLGICALIALVVDGSFSSTFMIATLVVVGALLLFGTAGGSLPVPDSASYHEARWRWTCVFTLRGPDDSRARSVAASVLAAIVMTPELARLLPPSWPRS